VKEQYVKLLQHIFLDTYTLANFIDFFYIHFCMFEQLIFL